MLPKVKKILNLPGPGVASASKEFPESFEILGK
jgi:hypothetical protein